MRAVMLRVFLPSNGVPSLSEGSPPSWISILSSAMIPAQRDDSPVRRSPCLSSYL